MPNANPVLPGVLNPDDFRELLNTEYIKEEDYQLLAEDEEFQAEWQNDRLNDQFQKEMRYEEQAEMWKPEPIWDDKKKVIAEAFWKRVSNQIKYFEDHTWYYKDRIGNTHGPCTTHILRENYVAGVVDESTLVYTADFNEFLPIGNCTFLPGLIRNLEVQFFHFLNHNLVLKPRLWLKDRMQYKKNAELWGTKEFMDTFDREVFTRLLGDTEALHHQNYKMFERWEKVGKELKESEEELAEIVAGRPTQEQIDEAIAYAEAEAPKALDPLPKDLSKVPDDVLMAHLHQDAIAAAKTMPKTEAGLAAELDEDAKDQDESWEFFRALHKKYFDDYVKRFRDERAYLDDRVQANSMILDDFEEKHHHQTQRRNTKTGGILYNRSNLPYDHETPEVYIDRMKRKLLMKRHQALSYITSSPDWNIDDLMGHAQAFRKMITRADAKVTSRIVKETEMFKEWVKTTKGVDIDKEAKPLSSKKKGDWNPFYDSKKTMERATAEKEKYGEWLTEFRGLMRERQKEQRKELKKEIRFRSLKGKARELDKEEVALLKQMGIDPKAKVLKKLRNKVWFKEDPETFYEKYKGQLEKVGITSKEAFIKKSREYKLPAEPVASLSLALPTAMESFFSGFQQWWK